ncbi:MAG: hypothetical protein KKC19_01325 [Nanoarchaeota archaeon]|nr:hypothetical protein [Nanoarchaeota archaeon]
MDKKSIPLGLVERIEDPKSFFKDEDNLKQVTSVVRCAFGRNLDQEDIYEHVTSPEFIYLLRNRTEVLAMASYNKTSFSGFPSLVVEGIAIKPSIQGQGVFREITDLVLDEPIICLRTQSPRMYRALEKYCRDVFPKDEKTPKAIEEILRELALYLDCKVEADFIIPCYYGGLFYGEEPTHKNLSNFFKHKLKMNLDQGDALLVAGVK